MTNDGMKEVARHLGKLQYDDLLKVAIILVELDINSEDISFRAKDDDIEECLFYSNSGENILEL